MIRPAHVVFALLFVSASYFYQGTGHNEAARMDATRAWFEHGRFWIDEFTYNSADIIRYQDGHFYSGKAPGNSLLAIPVYAAATLALRAVPISEAYRLHWVTYLVTVLTIAFFFALGGVVVFLGLLRLRETPRVALTVTLAVSLGTIWFPFATVFMSHSLTAALLMIAFYSIFATRFPLPEDQTRPAKWLEGRTLFGGWAASFAVTTEYPAAALTLLIGLYALTVWVPQKNYRLLVWFGVGLVVGIVPLFVYNWMAFQNLFYVPYEAYAQDSGAAFAAHKKGLLGLRLPFLDPDATPIFWNNFLEVTVRPKRGIVWFSPIFLLAIPGFVLAFAQAFRSSPLRLEYTLSFLCLLCAVVINSGYGDSIVYWGGGTSFGPRHLTMALPFLFLPLACLAQSRVGHGFLLIGTALSIFVCLMGTAVDPRTPYAPDNPVVEIYWPKFLSGEYNLTPSGFFSNELITERSVAFNWGGLMGFRAQWQLLPLFLAWAGGLFLFFRSLEVHRRSVEPRASAARE